MMCEVREAESTSGGVSRRVDVVGNSGADFDHIVLQLGEVADLEALTFILALMFIRNPNVQFSTEPAILPNCC